MATPRERLVEALKFLKELQDRGVVGIHTSEMPNRKYREILLSKGYIKEVTKGWYIPNHPDEKEGETTSWYSSYWEFTGKFLSHKYGTEWCIHTDQSLLLHAGHSTVPQQLIVRSPKGNNNPTALPHSTSVFNMKGDMPPKEQVMMKDGLRMYTLPAALIYCSASIYTRNAIDARTALGQIRDASEVLPILLEGGHSTLAGRLAGAFRNINRADVADQIVETMRQADYDVREDDPFETKLGVSINSRERSPYSIRIRLMWEEMRKVVIEHFPKAPGLPKDVAQYMQEVEDGYVKDAYHSLSIERYRVTPELIERVRTGQWDSTEHEEDRTQRDAMAARGYYLAFGQVKESIAEILQGANAGKQVERDHSKWYRQLFDPSVTAGILKVLDLAGYRNHQVYIGNSKHIPLSVDAMRDAMPVLFELLAEEPEASVRAVLGHYVFVYIHPYMDGNGRMGRFMMNAMLASGGYPWTIIPVESRSEYMHALDTASSSGDIQEFAQFIGKLVAQRMKEKKGKRTKK